jgi:alpha-N-arabinofuranosidase
LDTKVDLAAFGTSTIVEAVSIHNDDPNLANTARQPDAVTPAALADIDQKDGKIRASLPAMSWNLVRIAVG